MPAIPPTSLSDVAFEHPEGSMQSEHVFSADTGENDATVPQGREEWHAGVEHYALIAAVLVGMWWLMRRSSGNSTSRAHAGSKSIGSLPDAEQLRNKRLEALRKSTSERGDSELLPSSGEGLRQRVGASSQVQLSSEAQKRTSSESEGFKVSDMTQPSHSLATTESTSSTIASATLTSVSIEDNATREEEVMRSAIDTAVASEVKPDEERDRPQVCALPHPAVQESLRATLPESHPAQCGNAQLEASNATADSPRFWIRAQGTIKGHVESHRIEGLCGAMSVNELHDAIASAFGSGKDVRHRLFYMGREMKDGTTSLASVALKNGATLTIMLSTKDARKPSDESSQSVNGISCALSPTQLPATVPVTQAASTSSPADAWQAVLELEQQLSRANNDSEAPAVRQASATLRSMLQSVSGDSNPVLLQSVQMMVPTLAVIWNFEPTRDYLNGLLGVASSGGAETGELSTEQ